MIEKTLKFNNIRVNKKEFHKSKQPIDLKSVNVDQIVVSDKFKHSDEGFKYFIGYCIGYCILLIKNKLSIKVHSKPVYDKKYLKTKVREFDSVIKTNFLSNATPKENTHSTCIACITIDSVMRIYKKTIRRFI